MIRQALMAVAILLVRSTKGTDQRSWEDPRKYPTSIILLAQCGENTDIEDSVSKARV